MIFSIRSFIQKKKDNFIITEQKEAVELQKQIIEEKNREVHDSITYAKRIQSAILPSDNTIKTALPDSFVLYKLKDIVSCDFYWLESFPKLLYFEGID